jgi:plastocyanin
MRRIALALALVATLALALGACASGKATGLPAGPTTGGPAANGVEIVDSLFKPATLTVPAGTTVDWSQTGSAPHSVTADDGSFDSSPGCRNDTTKCLQSGGDYSHAFTKPGRYAYYCVIHGGKGGVGMAGTIVVEAS